ncbi:uncharacterized protein LKV04_004490 [Tautogolabrus adspersus]
MSAASCLLTEDQFLCSICLDVFTDPVTTPCGHNFCKACITTHWNINAPYQCPNCNKVFNTRPELQVNTFISEIVAQYKQAAKQNERKKAELKRVQQYEVNVTLDPNTANPYLILSDDGKRVQHGDVKKNLPDNPERFSWATCVLAKQSISSGRFYYEVQVKGKTDWTLGVAAESMNRKGGISLMPPENWTIWLRNENTYQALTGRPVLLSLKSKPEKVGVFVDYEEGVVSFYDVDTAALIYSFTGCFFTGNLFPIFCPGNNRGGENSTRLIISPVNHTYYFFPQVAKMSAASCLLTEDQFLCSICLDVFTNPVSTPCGHNFCKACITTHWNFSVSCQCPNCKEVFYRRPELKVNTFISEMAAQYKQSAQQKASSSSSEQHVSKPGEVPCDVCTGTKLKAQKSCLVCLVSYCETHLEPHLTMSGLKRHQLIDPVENLEGRICTKHDKMLEMFCKNDQMCVCMLCSLSDHKKHDVVPLKEEYERKKTKLWETETEILQIIQKRRQKIQEIKHSVELSNRNADREITEGVQVFNTLMETVERKLNMLLDTIKEKQRKTEKQAEGFIKELEQEISELEKRSTEVKQLSSSEDPLQLLKNVQPLNAYTPTKDWTEVRVHPPSYEGTVARAVSQLEETIREQMKKSFVAELRRVQQYAVNVRVDPDVVHPKPPGRHRGNDCRCVLSMHGFTSGQFYFEVSVKKESSWTLGVVRKLSNLKETITLSPTNGHWTVCLSSQGEYFAAAGPSVRLSLKSGPEKVGVFVDYEEGLVSFYDVNAAALIYSFIDCSFFEDLYPFFSPCQNNGVTIHSSDWGCVLQ